MSCHGCASSFGLFSKEKGCPNCGFSFCGKCLRYKAVVPKLGSELNVCKKCYTVLMEGEDKSNLNKEQYSPPAAFLRRLESLENPARPPITVYQHDQRMEQLKSGLTTPMDREIVERLERLREERKKREPSVSEEEILRRLSALKGENEDQAVAMAKKKINLMPDTRSNEEKTNSLIKQLLEEQILSAKQIRPEDMIAERLAKLRGHEPVASGNASEGNMEVLKKDMPEVQSQSLETTKFSDLASISSDELKSLLQQADMEVREAHKALQGSKNKKVESSDADIGQEEDSSSDEDVATNKIVDKLS